MVEYDWDEEPDDEGELDRDMVIMGQAMGPGRKQRKFARAILLRDKIKIKKQDIFYPLRLLKRQLFISTITTLIGMIFLIVMYTIECPVVNRTRVCIGSTEKLDCDDSTKDFYRECWKPEVSCWIDQDTRCAPTQCMVHSLTCPEQRICIASEFQELCIDPVLNAFGAISIATFVGGFLAVGWSYLSIRSKKSEIAVDHIIEEEDDGEIDIDADDAANNADFVQVDDSESDA